MKQLFIVGAMLLMSVSILATSRDKIAQIRVGREGSFVYWNEKSAVLQSLKEFVNRVTDESSTDFVPADERVAVFDLDGTLICETAPTYFEWLLYLHRVLEDDTYQPSAEAHDYALKVREAVDSKVIPAEMDWGEAWAQNAAFTGMTLDEYADYVRTFSNTAVEGYNGMLWSEAFYLPMVEVVSYLAANDFKTYIVSGSERQLLRVLANGVLQFETNHIIGSDVETFATEQGETAGMDYVFKATDDIVRGKLMMKNLKMNKVNSIAQEIGIRPILAFGNSTGDFSMFQYTTTNKQHKGLAFCVLADDTERENGNPTKAASIKERCNEAGWHTISMRDDWNTIYGEDVVREQSTGVTEAKVVPNVAKAYTLDGMPVTSSYSGIVIRDNRKVMERK